MLRRLFFVALATTSLALGNVSAPETTAPGSFTMPPPLPSYDADDPTFLLGFNLPWNHFGYDFGCDRFDAEFFTQAYREARAMGMNAMRVWIHCDGRGSPEWDLETGAPTRLPDGFFADFGKMLDLAAAEGIAVMPALWSFDMVKDRSDDLGPTAGTHARFLNDPALVTIYLEQMLVPLVVQFDAHPALYAWEICNEPEWMQENYGQTKEAVQRFIGMHAAVLQRHAQKPVTNGASSTKFNAEPPMGESNWWSDAELQRVTGDPDASLDFYQIHAYGWMMPMRFEPYTWTAADLQLDKPVMIGEAPAIGMTPPAGYRDEIKALTPAEMTLISRENGYFGHYLWSFSGHDGVGGREEIGAAMETVRQHWAEPGEND